MVIEEYYIRICSCMREPDLRDLSPRSFSSEKDFRGGVRVLETEPFLILGKGSQRDTTLVALELWCPLALVCTYHQVICMLICPLYSI